MKSSEHNLEAKRCVDLVDEDSSLPPVRCASQQNQAHKVASYSSLYLSYHTDSEI